MARDPVIEEISGLTLVTQKMVDEQEKERKAAGEARKERMKELNDQIKESKAQKKGNTKELRAAKAELEKIKDETKANKAISEEISKSTASALGISTDDLKIRKDEAVALDIQTKALGVLADDIKAAGGDPEKSEEYLKRSAELQAKTNELAGKSLVGTASALGISADALQLRKDQAIKLDIQTKALGDLAEEIKAAGGDPEKNEEYLKQSAELQAKTNELAGRSLVGMEADKHTLEQMKISLEKSGGIATDNKKYNEMSLDIQQKALDLRKATAETPAAKKEIADEQKRINAERAGLLGRIARGMDWVKENAKEKMKAAGKGIMAILKGTLIAGFLVALIAFFNSKYWKQTKEWIVDKGLPMLKNLWATLSEGFGKLADFFKDPSMDNFLKILNPKSALVLAIAGVVASLTVAKFLGPFIKGIGLLKSALGGVGGAAAKLIPGMGGGKDAVSKVSGKVKGGSAGAKFGQVIGNIGKGLGKGIEGILRGLAMGLSAFANPKVLIGAGILAGSILVIGAGIAGAAWLLGQAFPTLVDGLKSFERLDGEKLKTVAIGVGAIGLALFALGAGGAMQGLGSMVGAITGSIGKFFGAKDPLVQLRKFSEAKIDVAQAKKNAEAMVAYSKAMALGGGAEAVKGLGQFVGGIAGSIGKFFGGKDAVDPLTNLIKFGSKVVNAKNVKANAAAMKDYAAAMKDFPETPVKLGEFMNRSLGALAKAFGVKEGVGTPLDSLNNFGSKAVNAANIKTNAAAMKDYAAAMKDFPATPVKLGAFINGMLDSLGSFLGITKKTESPLQKLENFGLLKVDAANIKTNAEAMTLYGNAMKTLPKPAGGWAAVGAFVGGVFSSLGKLVGLEAAKSPLQKLKEFGEFIIGKDALKRIPETAAAMQLYGKAMAAAPKPKGGWDAIGDMFGGIAKSFLSLFGGGSDKPSPLEQLKKFGAMAINAAGVTANAKAFELWSAAMSKGAPGLKTAFKDLEIDENADKALGIIEKHPLASLKKFSAEAFAAWVNAMKAGIPMLTSVFKNFKGGRGFALGVQLLNRLTILGEKATGLEIAGRGIKSLGENMLNFVNSIAHYEPAMGDKLDDLLDEINNRKYSKTAAGGLQATANLIQSITEMSKIDNKTFQFPIPKKSDIQAYQTLTASVTRALEAINELPKGSLFEAGTFGKFSPIAAGKKETPLYLHESLRKQAGGPMSKGVPYLVGEGGPELIIPNQPAQVMNAQKTAEMKERKLATSAGSQGASAGTNIVSTPIITNSTNNSNVSVAAVPLKDSRAAGIARSN